MRKLNLQKFSKGQVAQHLFANFSYLCDVPSKISQIFLTNKTSLLVHITIQTMNFHYIENMTSLNIFPSYHISR